MLAEIGKIIMRKHTRKCMLTHTQMCTFLDRKSQAHTSPIPKPEQKSSQFLVPDDVAVKTSSPAARR